MNFVKRTSKRENTIENHALPPVHVQWKEENQYKNESFFSTCGEGEKEVPYIFFHNFTACQWKLTTIRWRVTANRYPLAAGCIPKRRVHQTPLHQTPLLLMYNNIAPAGRHHHPLNLLNPVNPHVRILHRMRKSAEVGP